MSRIMIIAGGDWQCPIVKTAKKMGHFVICSNLYRDSPAFAFSDTNETADVLDKEKNLEIARKYRPDAVLTDQSDIAVPTVAYVAEQMGLKGIGMQQALLYTDKYHMREFCHKHGFPTPEYRLCQNLAQAEEFFQYCLSSGKKAIIKPLDSQSSRGVHIISTVGQLEKYFPDSIKYSNCADAVLIEQYIEGTEFTVDGLKTTDGYYVTAISKKKPFSHNPNIAKELLFSNYDPEFDYDNLRQINRQFVLQTGLPFGLTHAEYKYMDDKFYLIEIAARGGGTRISSDIVPVMSGINSNRIYIQLLLGYQQPVRINYRPDIYTVLGFFNFKSGTVSAVKGLEEAVGISGMIDLQLNFTVGSTISKATDDRSRAGYYIISTDSYTKLRQQEAKMKKLLRITYR